jgi:hypoxanthine phosphoribosyltransferase
MLAAYSLAREHAVDSVIGFPSGGTQMAITTAVACEILHELCPRTVNVICVSLSQHSGTTKEGATPISDECLDASIDVSADSIRGKRVIIVDDNSSTGSTISRGMRAIQKLSPTFIACGVGEIDPQRALIRARKAASEEKILGVADMRHELFEGAMGIVPVSGRDIQLRKEYAGRVLGTISGTSKV